VRNVGDRGYIFDGSEKIRGLEQHAGRVGGDGLFQFLQVEASCISEACGGERHALVMRVSGEHFAVFRMQALCNDHGASPGDADRHHGRFGRGGRSVVHGGVGHFHAGQFRDHGLEFEDCLQRALRDLGLIRRIGGEEFSARNQ
jgi:hypothetical protein